jgi:hypothetical protein
MRMQVRMWVWVPEQVPVQVWERVLVWERVPVWEQLRVWVE